jgi:hypothetical protein
MDQVWLDSKSACLRSRAIHTPRRSVLRSETPSASRLTGAAQTDVVKATNVHQGVTAELFIAPWCRQTDGFKFLDEPSSLGLVAPSARFPSGAVCSSRGSSTLNFSNLTPMCRRGSGNWRLLPVWARRRLGSKRIACTNYAAADPFYLVMSDFTIDTSTKYSPHRAGAGAASSCAPHRPAGSRVAAESCARRAWPSSPDSRRWWRTRGPASAAAPRR